MKRLIRHLFLAAATIGGASAQEASVAEGGQVITLPVRVHLVQSEAMPAMHTTLVDADVERVMGKVNMIWSQAGIQFDVESIGPTTAVAMPPSMRLKPEAVRVKSMIPPSRLSPIAIDICYVKQITPNGFYGGELIVVKDTARLREVPGGIDEPLPRVTAHEIGHALGLQHRQQRTNLMQSGTTGFLLNEEEIGIARKKAQEMLDPHKRVVVLTFDDSVASHATFVAPLLKKHGFGATFFITEGFEFLVDKKNYMTWEQIKALHDDGFEIGNHTRKHTGVAKQTPAQLAADVEFIEMQCAKHGIPRPVSFCYPGYQTSEAAVKLLRERGYLFARAGGAQAFDPAKDEPLTIPQAFDGKPDSTLEQFQAAVAQARDGKIAVITFHGVPDIQHPWVNTDPAKFEAYMAHLKAEGCTVIAMRDLEGHVVKK